MPRVSNTVDQARTLLERRLRELDDERKHVEAALAGLGRKMKLNHPNYLYRVLPDLQKEGRIKRKGKGYHPG